jgi:hypothetical protein
MAVPYRRCSHFYASIQGISRAAVPSPLRSVFGVACKASPSQLVSVASLLLRILQVISSHDSASCQICLEKGHSISRCHVLRVLITKQTPWVVLQPTSCRAAVQHRSCRSSQVKKFTLGGAQNFQVCLQEGDGVEPWNVAM